MILIPVKNLASAKQRLAAILDQPTRTELAQAMLRDVLETLAGWPHCPEVGIVTSDSFAVQLAQKFQFTVIADTNNRSVMASPNSNAPPNAAMAGTANCRLAAVMDFSFGSAVYQAA